jgi:hypothetical protein
MFVVKSEYNLNNKWHIATCLNVFDLIIKILDTSLEVVVVVVEVRAKKIKFKSLKLTWNVYIYI